jgi:hypothetical protein
MTRLLELLTLAALLGVGAAPSGAPPAASPSGGEARSPDPDDELQSLLRTLREERAAYYGRQRARAAAIESARQAIARLETEVAELAASYDKVVRDLAEVDAEIAELRGRRETNDAFDARFRSALDDAVAGASQFVRDGIDYRREDRLERLGAGAPEGAPPTERLGRFWSFVQEELRLARSGETYGAEIPLEGGRRKHARIVRVGHLLQGFVTEDGIEAGLETRAGWRTDEAAVAENVRKAVEMLDRRRAPALLVLPLERRAEP